MRHGHQGQVHFCPLCGCALVPFIDNPGRRQYECPQCSDIFSANELRQYEPN